MGLLWIREDNVIIKFMTDILTIKSYGLMILIKIISVLLEIKELMAAPFIKLIKGARKCQKLLNVVHHRADHIIERNTFSWHSSFHLKLSITQQQNMDSFSKERRIILAIEVIKNNKNLSYSMVAQIYKVP